MIPVAERSQAREGDTGAVVSAPFFIRGVVVEKDEVRHTSRDLGVDFMTPEVDLDALIAPRSELPPLLDVKLSEIIDFLVETGQRLTAGNSYLEACVERMAVTNVLPLRIIKNQIRDAGNFLNKPALEELVAQSFRDPRCLDEWIPREDYEGRRCQVRAFPTHLIHVLPGNSPIAAVRSIAQSAMAKAVNLFKMGSSDPFSAVAILRTMADVDPNHPVVRSMSAIYWRGGDESIERVLYRPQYFDKIVAWGGGDAINNVIKYLGPGFQLISFDPKTSISMVGAEAFESEETLNDAAERAGADIALLNQEACASSRFVFIEGKIEEVDRFCARLLERLGVDRKSASAKASPPPAELNEEIDALRILDEDFRVWGKGDGRGLVIRSDAPVDFHPTNKTANVVRVSSLADAVRYVNVATQTIGIYPFHRKGELRDQLAGAGAQRLVRLGEVGMMPNGVPHDAMYPMHLFVHWISDEDAGA